MNTAPFVLNTFLLLLGVLVCFFVGVYAERARAKRHPQVHPIDQLWGRFDEVKIELVHYHTRYHGWNVHLPQAGVHVHGHPNDPDVGNVIEQAVEEVKQRSNERVEES